MHSKLMIDALFIPSKGAGTLDTPHQWEGKPPKWEGQQTQLKREKVRNSETGEGTMLSCPMFWHQINYGDSVDTNFRFTGRRSCILSDETLDLNDWVVSLSIWVWMKGVEKMQVNKIVPVPFFTANKFMDMFFSRPNGPLCHSKGFCCLDLCSQCFFFLDWYTGNLYISSHFRWFYAVLSPFSPDEKLLVSTRKLIELYYYSSIS